MRFLNPRTITWYAKGIFIKIFLVPLFYKKIGKGVKFSGRIRLPAIGSNIYIGDNCTIGHDVYLQTSRDAKIVIGENSSINSGTHIIAATGIEIGKNVAIAEYVSIRDAEHGFSKAGVEKSKFKKMPIKISDGVWIGRGVYIAPGANIGYSSIIGANSVVKNPFGDHVLIVGSPAYVKKNINE